MLAQEDLYGSNKEVHTPESLKKPTNKKVHIAPTLEYINGPSYEKNLPTIITHAMYNETVGNIIDKSSENIMQNYTLLPIAQNKGIFKTPLPIKQGRYNISKPPVFRRLKDLRSLKPTEGPQHTDSGISKPQSVLQKKGVRISNKIHIKRHENIVKRMEHFKRKDGQPSVTDKLKKNIQNTLKREVKNRPVREDFK